MSSFTTSNYRAGLTVAIVNSGQLPVYVGYADVGSATSAAVWQIKKITYDGDGLPTRVQWAGGKNEFKNVMDNYASYTYS